MTHSSFEWRADLRDTTALPYGEDSEVLPNYVFTEAAAAGLYASAADLAIFLAAGLAGPGGETPGRGVLSRAGVELMFTPADATHGSLRAWVRNPDPLKRRQHHHAQWLQPWLELILRRSSRRW